MLEQSSVFRKVSIERLSSPEQLDQKLTVVSPIGWIATISVAILILAAIIWGILGIIPNRVFGSGILMHSDGIVRITSHTGGRITEVNVRAGEHVESGQIVARVAQDELMRQIAQVQENIAALESINVETLDLDIAFLNDALYSRFAQMAGQVRTARIQHEVQRAEAQMNEQDITNRRLLQAQQISVLESQIATLEEQILQHQELLEHQRLVELENAEILDQQQYVQQNQIASVLRLLQEDLERATQQLANAESLFAAGVIPRSELDATNNNVLRIEGEIESRLLDINRIDHSRLEQVQNRPAFDAALASMHSQLETLRLQLIQARMEAEHLNVTFADMIWGAYNQTGVQISSIVDQFAHQQQIMLQDYLRLLDELQEQYDERSTIIAPFSGIVSNLTIQLNDLLQPGGFVGNIVQGGLDAGSSNVILYVPLYDAVLIEEGMEVNVSPSTVNREEHGYIIGKVVSVSASSVTHEHMIATLQNPLLVQTFSGQTAVMEVEVKLLSDYSTASGFLWSTPRGAPFAISPGTISNGEIIVSYQRPIDMVIPFIRRLFM